MPTKELENIIQKWLDWLTVQKNYSKNTIDSYLNDLKLFLEHFSKEKAIDVADLDNLEIRDFRNFFSLRAKSGISKTSIAREESAIKNFYKWLNENKIIENTDNDDENLYKIAPVKNDKVRYLCVDDEIMEIFRSRLEEQKEQRKRAGDLWYEPFPNLVFENEFGKHFTHCTARKHFKKSVAKIGLPAERFHNLRHNYTARALEAGDDVTTVQKNLGHSTANFTLKVYAHGTEEAQKQSAKNMNDRIKMLKELMA